MTKKDETHKELQRQAEAELDALLDDHKAEQKAKTDALLNDAGFDKQTSLNLSPDEYDELIQAIEERNRLTSLISDIICKGYKEAVKK